MGENFLPGTNIAGEPEELRRRTDPKAKDRLPACVTRKGAVRSLRPEAARRSAVRCAWVPGAKDGPDRPCGIGGPGPACKKLAGEQLAELGRGPHHNRSKRGLESGM